jgi:hypothetical protein
MITGRINQFTWFGAQGFYAKAHKFLLDDILLEYTIFKLSLVGCYAPKDAQQLYPDHLFIRFYWITGINS